MKGLFLFASFYFFLVLILAWITFYVFNYKMCNCILTRKKPVKAAISHGGVCQAELFVFWRVVGSDYQVEANAVTLNDIPVPFDRNICRVIGDPDTGHEVIAKFKNSTMIFLIDLTDKKVFKDIKKAIGKYALLWFLFLGGVIFCFMMLQKHNLENNTVLSVMFSLLNL